MAGSGRHAAVQDHTSSDHQVHGEQLQHHQFRGWFVRGREGGCGLQPVPGSLHTGPLMCLSRLTAVATDMQQLLLSPYKSGKYIFWFFFLLFGVNAILLSKKYTSLSHGLLLFLKMIMPKNIGEHF